MKKRYLVSRLGQIKVNETPGLLFLEDGEIEFAYRSASQRVCVDDIGPKSRQLRLEGEKLTGYNLSGIPSENDYSGIEPMVPRTPVLGELKTPYDLNRFEDIVVIYRDMLAVSTKQESWGSDKNKSCGLIFRGFEGTASSCGIVFAQFPSFEMEMGFRRLHRGMASMVRASTGVDLPLPAMTLATCVYYPDGGFFKDRKTYIKFDEILKRNGI